MNKRNEAIVSRYEKSTATSLRQVYGTFSKKKEDAWENCVGTRLVYEEMGYKVGRLKILGASCYQFSAAFTAKKEDGIYLVYITKSGAEEIKIEGDPV